MPRKPLFETFAPGGCENKGAGRIASRVKRGAAGKVRRAVNAVVAALLAFIMVFSPLAPATPAMAAGLGDLFGLLSPRSENVLATQGKKDLRIAVVSDTHYYPLNYVTDCEDYRTYVGGDPKMLEESGSIIDAAFDMVKADRPDLLLISGDLTKDGEVQGLTDIAAKLAEVEKAGTQVYVINGNHDIYNSDACTFADGKKEQVESASPAKFREIFAAHGYDGAEGQTYYKDSEQAKEAKKEYNPGLFNTDDDIPGCLSYTVDLGNYMILAIDSGQYLPSAGTGLDTKEHITAGRIDKHVLAWAEEQVKAADAEGKTIVGLMHHGLIPHFKGEDNVLSEYVVDNWRHVATTLADAGMRYIFTGHMHANDVAEFTTPKGNHITDLETGSLSAYGTPVRTVSIEKGDALEGGKRTHETFSVTSKSVEEVTLQFANGTSQQVSSLTEYASEKLYGEKMFNNLAGGMLRPILQEIGSTGLRAWLQQNLPDLDIHQIALDAIAGGLAGGIDMDLGTIGRVHVDYRNNAINLTPSGIAGIVGAASVSDQQIVSIIDDLLDQVEAKYIDKPDYLLGEVDKIVTQVSEYGVASLDDGQKSLYDLVFVLLTGHYAGHEDAPAWTETALEGIRSGALIQNLINTLVDSVTAEGGLIDTLLGSLNINVGLAFSGTWKTVINNATDNGNLKSVLGLAGLDNAGVKGLINGLIGEYMSPSFLTGMGGIVGDICDSMLHDTDGGDNTAIDGSAPVNDDRLNDAQSPFTVSFDGQLKPQQPSAENGLLPTQVTMTLGKDPQTDRSVRWFTGTQVSNGTVQVSATRDFENAKTYKATSEQVVKPRTQLNLGLVTSYGTQPAMKHSAEIAGLRENASYYYRVGSEDLDIWSEPIRFATGAAGDDEDTFTFLNLNDSQGMVKADYATYLNTLGKANEMFPGASFVLHAGDFVDDGANEDYWTWALDDPANIAQGLAMMPAAGNHEARSNVPGITDANPIASHFNLSGVDVPEQDQASGVYYSFTYKNATVVVLNSNDLEGNALSQKQYAWANEVLSGADTTWKIVLLHKSAYSNGPHHDDADVLAIRRQLDQLAADNKVDLVLSGHDHVYNRTVPLSRGSEQEVESKTESYQGRNYEVQQAPNGTTFVIAGTAGVKNYEQSVAPEAHSAVSLDLDVPVFAGFKIDGDRLYYDAYKVEGGAPVRVDNFAISKDVAEQQAWEKVVDLIAALPEQSKVALSDEDAIVAARGAYDRLSEEDRALVSNVERLTAAEKTLAALKDVAGKETRTVTSYKDLKAAVADPNVGKVVVNGHIEGKDTVFSPDRDVDIAHDVVVEGSGEISFVQLHVKNGATLVLGGSLVINDVRTAGSLFPSLDPVEVQGGGTLIMRDAANLRTEYGTGDGNVGSCVRLTGEGASAILGSRGSFSAATSAVYSPAENTSIVVENGTYTAKNNDHFAIDTRGSLTIAGGTVSNAWVGPNGSFRMTGGTLEHQGGSENAKPSLALECADSYLTAGTIVPFNGAAVELRGASKLHVLAKKAGDVKIGDVSPYMGSISTSNYRDVVVGYTEVNGWNDVDGIYRAEGAGNTSSVDRIAELAKTAGKVGTTHESGYMKAALPNGTNPVFGRYMLHGEGKNGGAMGLTGSGSAVVYGPVRVIENNPVTAVEIAAEKVRVADLGTRESADVQLTASVKPENAFDNAITWETSNKDASKVAPYGLVTMTKPGATTVTAKVASNNDLTDSAIVLGVKPAIEGPDAIEQGDELNAAFKAKDGMGKLDEQYQGLVKFTWSTSNEEIAVINPETGELTEVKQAGSVDVIATLWVKSAGKDSGDWAQTGIAARKTVVIKGEPTAPTVDAVNALLDVKVSDTMKVGEGAAHETKTFESLVENTEGANDSYEIGAVYDAKARTTGLAAIAEFFGMAEPAHVWCADVTVKAAPYVAAFDKDAKLGEGVHKLAKDQADSAKIAFEWNDETGAWKLAEGSESPIEFKVTCAKTVTFDANGGKLADEAQKTRSVGFGEKLGEMPEATREDHEFLGWFDAAEHGTEVNAETTVDFIEAKTYYAQWRQLDHVTITFDPNGGAFAEGDTPKRVHVAKDGKVTEQVEAPTFEGRTFLGWTGAKGDRRGLVDLNDKTFGEDTVLYALWETEVTSVTSTVTFNPNGGKLPEGAPESQQIAFGGTIAVLPEPTRIGYEFLGWFDADRKFEAGATGVTGPIDLTARWTPIMVSVSFDAQGGTFAADGAAERQVAYGSMLGELPEVSRENFEFLGWFDAEAGGNKVTANTVVDFAEAKTYYAQWEAKPAPDMSIAVTFNAGEGHFGEDGAAHTAQRAFTKPATLHTSDVPAVFRDGYTLEGWYASKGFEEGTRVVFADEFGDQDTGGANVTVLNGDIELHARWLLNSWEMVDAPTAERPSSGPFDGRPHGVDLVFDERFPESERAKVTVEYRASVSVRAFSDADGWTAEAPIAAGVYDIRIGYAGTDEYAGFEIVHLRALEIEKAVLAGEPKPESTEVKRGTKLADIKLGGTAAMADGQPVKGAWSWVDAQGAVEEDGEFIAVFVPEDLDDIEPLYVKVALTVKADSKPPVDPGNPNPPADPGQGGNEPDNCPDSPAGSNRPQGDVAASQTGDRIVQTDDAFSPVTVIVIVGAGAALVGAGICLSRRNKPGDDFR